MGKYSMDTNTMGNSTMGKYSMGANTMCTIAAKSSKPWRGAPYKTNARPNDNNGVVAHYHHNQNPLLFTNFHRQEESPYVRRSRKIGILMLRYKVTQIGLL